MATGYRRVAATDRDGLDSNRRGSAAIRNGVASIRDTAGTIRLRATFDRRIAAETSVPKGRNPVSTGVSPWIQRDSATSPEGATSARECSPDSVPSGLNRFVGTSFHGLTPMATGYRRVAATDRDGIDSNRRGSAAIRNGVASIRHTAGTIRLRVTFDRRIAAETSVPKGRNPVGTGVSPWKQRDNATSPDGATSARECSPDSVPSGLNRFVGTPFHGLTPMATGYRRVAATDRDGLDSNRRGSAAIRNGVASIRHAAGTIRLRVTFDRRIAADVGGRRFMVGVGSRLFAADVKRCGLAV